MNSSFSPTVPKLQLAWDSTSLGALKKCARYYELAIIEGWQSRLGSIHLEFGIFYHSATEFYDHQRANGLSHEPALLATVRRVLEMTWDSKLNRPWTTEDSNKNRFTLLRTIVWYLDIFQDDPMETVILDNGKPAIELSFRFEMGFGPEATPHQQYILCGHLDRLARMNGVVFILDKKTTKHTLDEKFFEQFSPDNQMSTYSFAGQIVAPFPVQGVIIDGAQVAVTFSRFGRLPTTRTPEQLTEWFQGVKVKIKENESYVKENFWPMNEKACYGCEFRLICRKSPSVRQPWLEKHFVKRVWDPLKIRGDI